MIDFEKLKHEWKTFAWAIVCILLESWDLVLAGQLGYVDAVIPPQWQWVTHIAIPVGFLVLRRWKSTVEEKEPVEGHP